LLLTASLSFRHHGPRPPPRDLCYQMTRANSLSKRIALAVLEDTVRNLTGPVGHRLRALYWRSRLRSMGRGVTIGIGVKIQNPEYVSIGDDTWIDDYVIILAGPVSRGERHIVERKNPDYAGREGEVHIGARCHIAPFVICSGHAGLSIGADSGVASGAKLYSLSHHVANKTAPDTREQPYLWSPRVPGSRQTLIAGPIVLETATGIGLNTVVLPGSTIESGSLIGIGVTVSGRVRSGVTVSAVAGTREKDRWEIPPGAAS